MSKPKPKNSPKKVTVALADLGKVCHACGKVKKTVAVRTYYAKNYTGRCGDSFCAGSCDSSSCFPISGQVCDACATAGKEPVGRTERL